MLSPNQRLCIEAQATPDEIFVPPAAPMTSRTSPSVSTNIAGHMDDKGRFPDESRNKVHSNICHSNSRRMSQWLKSRKIMYQVFEAFSTANKSSRVRLCTWSTNKFPLGICPLHGFCDSVVSKNSVSFIHTLWCEAIFIKNIKDESQDEARSRRLY
ncbi:hypothetical protein E2C01_038478 [Portunus trituberculatus]|uniref:Uncharacterized protein n=1 Tax=Portunus trituberculatus TaxID=210409 RepID=A0A5B7FIM7_PORTR|nr:hypothetical protein [Portunus trituberculatus]